MDDDSVTSFLESVVEGALEKKIIRLLSEDIDQEKMLERLLSDLDGGEEGA